MGNKFGRICDAVEEEFLVCYKMTPEVLPLLISRISPKFEQAIEDEFDTFIDFVSGFHVRRVKVFVIRILFVVMTFGRS